MITYKAKSISRVDDRTYRVVLEANDGVAEVAFEMTVEGSDIAVVEWGRDFSDFVQRMTGPLGPLFEAVLRFHEATLLDVQGKPPAKP